MKKLISQERVIRGHKIETYFNNKKTKDRLKKIGKQTKFVTKVLKNLKN